jgi:hypothetical protein
MGTVRFDNRVINIISEGEEDFIKALSFFFFNKTTVTHYEINEEYGLIFYWSSRGLKDITALPYEMNYDAAASFAWNWLKIEDYKKQPDHDGDNHKGFQVFNEAWTHVNGRWQALVAIRPVWAMYGK